MSQFTPVPLDGYLVGGALRDALLGRSFQDIDWLVADPEAAARQAAVALAGSVFPLDEERGHWRVVAESRIVDYIRLETDLESNLHERDFTINAIAADATGKVIDPLSGQQDLKLKTIRMTSRDSILADPLRILRALRFVVQLGFKLEDTTKVAITDCTQKQLEGTLPLPAWERIAEELNKILLSEKAAYGFKLMAELGMIELYLPELAAAKGVEQGGFHHLEVLDHSLEVLNQLVQGFPEADLSLRWAALLHDVGKPQTKIYDDEGHYYHFYGHDKLGAELSKSMLLRLRQPAEQIERVAGLIRYHMLQLPKNDREARRFIHRRRELLPDLMKLMIADREAARGPLSSEASRNAYRLAFGRVLGIMAELPPVAAAPLLDGHEVMKLLALSAGPRVGEAMHFLSEAVAVGDVRSKGEAEAALIHFAERQGWVDSK